jgi:uncharacterized Tic20 family protein
MEDEGMRPTDQNDQIMGALAHITVLLPMMGIVAPIVIWATQKDKSEFVAFQALQAVIYQLVIILGWFAGMVLYMCSFFGIFLTIPGMEVSDGEFPLPLLGMFIPMLIMGCMFLFGIIYVVYGVVAAIRVFQGVDFRYAVIGRRLESYLEKNT